MERNAGGTLPNLCKQAGKQHYINSAPLFNCRFWRIWHRVDDDCLTPARIWNYDNRWNAALSFGSNGGDGTFLHLRIGLVHWVFGKCAYCRVPAFLPHQYVARNG